MLDIVYNCLQLEILIRVRLRLRLNKDVPRRMWQKENLLLQMHVTLEMLFFDHSLARLPKVDRTIICLHSGLTAGLQVDLKLHPGPPSTFRGIYVLPVRNALIDPSYIPSPEYLMPSLLILYQAVCPPRSRSIIYTGKEIDSSPSSEFIPIY